MDTSQEPLVTTTEGAAMRFNRQYDLLHIACTCLDFNTPARVVLYGNLQQISESSNGRVFS